MAVIDWKKLKEVLEPISAASSAFLVGCAERSERGRTIIQIYVDTDAGISIGECTIISRALATRLEELNLIQEPYELEVSSPGIEKPLTMLRQYKKNVGRKFLVQYWHETERRTLKGALVSLDENRLTFVTEKNESTTIEFSKIIESIEELPW